MKISTKGRYALRVMVDLATNDNGNYINLKDIAKRQEISNKYLEQIIAMLNKAGFLDTARGNMGDMFFIYLSFISYLYLDKKFEKLKTNKPKKNKNNKDLDWFWSKT